MEATLDPLRFVKFYASIKHAGQTYSNGLPYTHHLAQVEAVARRFWQPDFFSTEYNQQEMLEACWLHDAIEDTGTKRKEIAEMFGERVARLVWAVSNEPGENQKARHAATYPKILKTPGAVFLKLCDRIANVEAGGKLVQMYRDEHDTFRRMLRTEGICDVMWQHLDRLLMPCC